MRPKYIYVLFVICVTSALLVKHWDSENRLDALNLLNLLNIVWIIP